MATLVEKNTSIPESPKAIGLVKLGYTIRWKQRSFDSETTGKRVYDSLDEVVALCEQVNARWKDEITQWPVEWELTRQGKKGQELANLKHLVGLE